MESLTGSVPAVECQRAANGLTAADLRSCPDLVDVLLKAAREDGTLEVRRACIRALVRCQAATPAVFAALEALAKDPVPAIRAEAVIGQGRLRTGYTPPGTIPASRNG
jgi:hypothetical protein